MIIASIQSLYSIPSLLFEKLFAFKTKVTGVDSASDKVDWPNFINANDSIQSFKAFQQQFHSISVSEAQTFLSSLQSDVLHSEQQHLLYCLQTTATWTHDFEVFEAIVGQNTKILKAGDALEITAGVGSFFQTRLPEITIAGKNVALNENGLAVHRIKTSTRLGNYSVPVIIQFIDQDGKPVERTFSVEYTVVDAIRKQ
ncbi:MAG: hypothetical protein EOO10_21085 [Chitinophagaceae bacterium]|nr:MAG: hypothetical protein EOO10_21085 [Chitinophagaceae bacterium]